MIQAIERYQYNMVLNKLSSGLSQIQGRFRCIAELSDSLEKVSTSSLRWIYTVLVSTVPEVVSNAPINSGSGNHPLEVFPRCRNMRFWPLLNLNWTCVRRWPRRRPDWWPSQWPGWWPRWWPGRWPSQWPGPVTQAVAQAVTPVSGDPGDPVSAIRQWPSETLVPGRVTGRSPTAWVTTHWRWPGRWPSQRPGRWPRVTVWDTGWVTAWVTGSGHWMRTPARSPPGSPAGSPPGYPSGSRLGHCLGHRPGYWLSHRLGHRLGHWLGHRLGHRPGHWLGQRLDHRLGHRPGHWLGHRLVFWRTPSFNRPLNPF